MQLSSDLPSAMAVEERRELTQLPSDLLSHILNACTDLTAAQLSSTCKRWLEVFNADGSRIARRAIGSLLSKFTRGLKPEHLLNSTRHGGPPWPRQLVKGSADISWGELALRLKSALAKLESMKSPGCQYQKYLRWLQGEPASSPTVVRGLLGVSMLPTSLADTVRLVPTAPQGKGAPRWPFLEIDDDHGQHSVPAESEDTKRTDWTLAVKRGLYVALSGEPGPSFPRAPSSVKRDQLLGSVDVPRFVLMLEWATGEQTRLRLVMAELHQIACRETRTFLTRPKYIATAERASQLERMPRKELAGAAGLDRQTVSFTHLVRIVAAATGDEALQEEASKRVDEVNPTGSGWGVQCWA